MFRVGTWRAGRHRGRQVGASRYDRRRRSSRAQLGRGDPDRGAWLALAIGARPLGGRQLLLDRRSSPRRGPAVPLLRRRRLARLLPARLLAIALHVRGTRPRPPGEHVARRPGRRALGRRRRHGARRRADRRARRRPHRRADSSTPPTRSATSCSRLADRRSSGCAAAGAGARGCCSAPGFAVFAAADTTYLLQLARAPTRPAPAGLLWLVGLALMALSAWQRADRRPRRGRLARSSPRRSASRSPRSACSYAGLRRAGPPRSCFAAAAAVAAMARTRSRSRDPPLRRDPPPGDTDDLTGLPNRRWFDRGCGGDRRRARRRRRRSRCC